VDEYMVGRMGDGTFGRMSGKMGEWG